jgi:hypothetical protein
MGGRRPKLVMEAVKDMQYRRAQPFALPSRRPIRLVMEAVKDMHYCPSQPGLLSSKLQSTSPPFVTFKALKTTQGVYLCTVCLLLLVPGRSAESCEELRSESR